MPLYDIELKGNHEKVMQRGVRKLAREIDRVIVGLENISFNKVNSN